MRRRLKTSDSASAVGAGAAPLVVAYAANPEVPTSVCLIGFRVAAGMSEQANARIIAHRRDRDALLRALPQARLTFVGAIQPGNAVRRLAERVFPGKWGLISMLDLPDYLLFDACAFLAARRLSRAGLATFVLRVNPISFRFPSLLPYLRVPVLTGPHNGGMDWPDGFKHLAALEGDSTGRVRGVGDVLHRLYGDSGRYARILVANEQCAATVPASGREKVVIMSENGVERLGEPSPYRGDARRLLFVGRLNTMKAVDIALRAMARLPDDVILTIVGDGPRRRSLEGLADELGIRHRVRFVGQVPHAEVDRYYSRAGVFLFPSVRESGGGAVLEAMSHGLACIVAAWGGPAIYTKDAGLHCRVTSAQVLEDDIVDAVTRLIHDPDAARALGEAARQAVARDYMWSEKVDRINEIALECAAARRVPASA